MKQKKKTKNPTRSYHLYQIQINSRYTEQHLGAPKHSFPCRETSVGRVFAVEIPEREVRGKQTASLGRGMLGMSVGTRHKNTFYPECQAIEDASLNTSHVHVPFVFSALFKKCFAVK